MVYEPIISNELLATGYEKSTLRFESYLLSQMAIIKLVFMLVNLIYYAELINYCGHPGTPSNGKIERFDLKSGEPHKITGNLSRNKFKPKVEVYYICDSNTFLYGNNKRQCLDSGNWSGHIPICG